MASSSLKTLVLRWPAAAPSAAGFSRCCPRTAFSPVTKPSADRFVCVSRVSLPRSFIRGRASLASGAQRSPAATNKPALSLESKTQTKPTPFSANLGVSGSRSFSTSPRRYTDGAQKAPNASTNPAAPLDWDTFFKLRVRRRYFQLFFSIVGGVGGGAAGAIFLAQGYAEPLVQQVPLDPFFTLGLMTFACAGLGWLIGPSIGSEIFYVINRRFKVQMRQKESQFLARVRKNRADPSNSSAINTVPDFYGEKIQSVKGYRQWLKDQRAFNKKKTQNFL